MRVDSIRDSIRCALQSSLPRFLHNVVSRSPTFTMRRRVRVLPDVPPMILSFILFVLNEQRMELGCYTWRNTCMYRTCFYYVNDETKSNHQSDGGFVFDKKVPVNGNSTIEFFLPVFDANSQIKIYSLHTRDGCI